MKRTAYLLMAALAALATLSCALPAGKPVVVASMIDSEGAILGKMMVKMLEANGIPVQDRTEFGTPDILRKALESGEVDLVLDYTGSGQYYHEGNDPSIWNDPARGYEKTRSLDAEKNDLHWLTPANANNTESLAVTRAFADATGVRDMAAFAAYVNAGSPVMLICAQSFADNPLGLAGLEEAYGFKLRKDQLILLSSGNTAEMLKALAEGINGVNVSLVYGTDGALDVLKLLVLDDPKHVPPVYLPSPVLRGDRLRQFPRIPAILEPLFKSLSLETLQALNAQVAYQGRDAGEVAAEYLTRMGFTGK